LARDGYGFIAAKGVRAEENGTGAMIGILVFSLAH
jgi:hypothetical protein